MAPSATPKQFPVPLGRINTDVETFADHPSQLSKSREEKKKKMIIFGILICFVIATMVSVFVGIMLKNKGQ